MSRVERQETSPSGGNPRQAPGTSHLVTSQLVPWSSQRILCYCAATATKTTTLHYTHWHYCQRMDSAKSQRMDMANANAMRPCAQQHHNAEAQVTS